MDYGFFDSEQPLLGGFYARSGSIQDTLTSPWTHLGIAPREPRKTAITRTTLTVHDWLAEISATLLRGAHRFFCGTRSGRPIWQRRDPPQMRSDQSCQVGRGRRKVMRARSADERLRARQRIPPGE
jgi:hypothetical protein